MVTSLVNLPIDDLNALGKEIFNAGSNKGGKTKN